MASLQAQQQPETKEKAAAVAAGKRKLIVILPFENQSKYPKASIQVADLFIAEVFKTKRLEIVHPLKVIQVLIKFVTPYVGIDNKDLAERIGKELGADAVLTGLLQNPKKIPLPPEPPASTAEKKEEWVPPLDISAHLIDVKTKDTIWRSNYTVDPLDALTNITQTVVKELSTGLVQKYLKYEEERRSSKKAGKGAASK